MIRSSLVSLIACFVMLVVVSTNASATSWASSFVVWKGNMYSISEETVTTVEKKIGHVTKYSDMEPHGGNFSNTFPKGTAYFSIKGVDPSIAIAVETGSGTYVKAYQDGEYEQFRPVIDYVYIALSIFACCIIGFILYSRWRPRI